MTTSSRCASWLKMWRATFSLFCAQAGYVPEAVDLS
jgi:hypothetical protein